MYLSPGRTVNATDIALELVNDAVYLGAEEVRLLQHEGWTYVAASLDWLSEGSKWTPEEAFFRLEFIHKYRQNANRSTVLLGAFASDIAIFSQSEEAVVLGCAAGTTHLALVVGSRLPLARVIAFRLPTEATASAA
jgi:hypothetical protein